MALDRYARTTNGGVSRVPQRSRHSHDLAGRPVMKPRGGSRWEYFRSGSFWVILVVVSLSMSGIFYLAKDVTVFSAARDIWSRVLEHNFFVSEVAPVYDENGVLLQQGELRITVPSKLEEAVTVSEEPLPASIRIHQD